MGTTTLHCGKKQRTGNGRRWLRSSHRDCIACLDFLIVPLTPFRVFHINALSVKKLLICCSFFNMEALPYGSWDVIFYLLLQTRYWLLSCNILWLTYCYQFFFFFQSHFNLFQHHVDCRGANNLLSNSLDLKRITNISEDILFSQWVFFSFDFWPFIFVSNENTIL